MKYKRFTFLVILFSVTIFSCKKNDNEQIEPIDLLVDLNLPDVPFDYENIPLLAQSEERIIESVFDGCYRDTKGLSPSPSRVFHGFSFSKSITKTEGNKSTP